MYQKTIKLYKIFQLQISEKWLKNQNKQILIQVYNIIRKNKIKILLKMI